MGTNSFDNEVRRTVQLAVLRAEQGKICENEAQEPSVKNTTGAKVKKRMRLIRTWEFQIFTIGFCDELKKGK